MTDVTDVTDFCIKFPFTSLHLSSSGWRYMANSDDRCPYINIILLLFCIVSQFRSTNHAIRYSVSIVQYNNNTYHDKLIYYSSHTEWQIAPISLLKIENKYYAIIMAPYIYVDENPLKTINMKIENNDMALIVRKWSNPN